MFEKKKYINCFENIHAPAGTLRRIFDMTINSKAKRKAPLWQRVSVAAAVFLAVMAISVTGIASHNGFSPAEGNGSLSSFLNSAFGTGIADQVAADVELTDSSGNVVKVVHYPATERVELEQEPAMELVGEQTIDINQGLTVDDYTLAVRYLLLDENGVGLLAYDVDNPNGHGLDQVGNPIDGVPKLSLLLDRGDGEMMDTRTYAQQDSFSSTDASYVCYFTPFSEFSAEDGLTVTIAAYEGEQTYYFPLEINIDNGDQVKSVSFRADGAAALLSPLGLYLTCDADTKSGGEVVYDNIVICYEDGSYYTVKGEGVVNIAVSSKNSDHKTCWYAFNRLVDAENVARILVTGAYAHGDGQVDELSYSFTKAD